MDILNRNKEHIAVMNCFCRTKKMLENGKCDYDMPIESCMAVGRMAVQLEKAGVARHISIDEARKLIYKLCALFIIPRCIGRTETGAPVTACTFRVINYLWSVKCLNHKLR